MPTFQQGHVVLNYQVFGDGKLPIIAFHGFSRTLNDYALYEDHLDPKYQVIAVDLFYHGKSKLDRKKIRAFSKGQLRGLFEAFIDHLNLDQFAVLGYSMGGRIALFFLEQFSNQITNLYLLAPDGLTTNFWNWLVMNTKTGKNLYGFTIHHPKWINTATKAGKKLRILPHKLDKFMELNFATKGMRLRVYRVWKLYKYIQFKQSELLENIQENNIKVHVVVGKKDPVVAPKVCKDFCNHIGKNARYHLIDAGHDLFKPHALIYIAKKVL